MHQTKSTDHGLLLGLAVSSTTLFIQCISISSLKLYQKSTRSPLLKESRKNTTYSADANLMSVFKRCVLLYK